MKEGPEFYTIILLLLYYVLYSSFCNANQQKELQHSVKNRKFQQPLLRLFVSPKERNGNLPYVFQKSNGMTKLFFGVFFCF